MKRYALFMSAAYGTAFFFEALAHFLDPLNKTFAYGLAGIALTALWYGAAYSISYVIFRESSLWVAALAWAVAGTAAEIILFHRVNFFADPFVYAAMIAIPLAACRKLFPRIRTASSTSPSPVFPRT